MKRTGSEGVAPEVSSITPAPATRSARTLGARAIRAGRNSRGRRMGSATMRAGAMAPCPPPLVLQPGFHAPVGRIGGWTSGEKARGAQPLGLDPAARDAVAGQIVRDRVG